MAPNLRALCILLVFIALSQSIFGIPLDNREKLHIKSTYDEETPKPHGDKEGYRAYSSESPDILQDSHHYSAQAPSNPSQNAGVSGRGTLNGHDDYVVELTDASIEDIILKRGSSSGRWLVAFTVPWCTYCSKLKPIWSELASKLHGKVHVARIDGDENRVSMGQFDVEGFPSIFLIQNGVYYGYPPTEPLTLAGFTQFIHGGFEAVKPLPLPEGVRWVDVVFKELIVAKNDVIATVRQRPDISLLLFMLGVLFGVIFCSLAFSCCIDRTLPEAVRQRVLSQPTSGSSSAVASASQGSSKRKAV